MSKFPNKTPYELRQYFNSLDLNQLIELNRSYGPHFVSLEERLDKSQEDLKQERKRLIQFQEKKQKHLLSYKEVETNEELFQKNMESVCSIQSRTDRYMGRQSLGYSPMQLYSSESLFIDTEISKASQMIQSLENIIASLEEKKTIAVSELRILNSIIDKRRKLMPEKPTPSMALS
ncbi:Uncharacterised protein [Legionella wadsworthii]|uniref:Uncharacterized protein n=1 Tax=Legionella wadsworthii TaxID=28088 RepID=A0A378LVM9_9GAMM|nr:hypothetical protein [Legionella wadsworthii]STY29882.1 Uncharacterised protein [Legionella wadsworthii]